jgi:hypothetical protein
VPANERAEIYEGKPYALKHRVCASDLKSLKIKKYLLYEFETMYRALEQEICSKWG